MRKKLFERMLVLCTAFLLLFSTDVFAEDGSYGKISDYITVNKDSIENVTETEVTVYAVDGTFSWNFPYSDSLFSISDDQYCHTLAQASLGLTASAFRPKGTEYETHADNIKSYFSSIGFTDVEADSYSSAPAADTIASAIAHKQIGDFTVIAVVCAGANYGKEWAGNLTVGDAERHEGFDYAAGIVEQRVKDYIEEYDLSGDLRLWTSGYSRAAAISNVVAADFTDSDLFSRVFAYSFATPRTTTNPGSYDNIFCIIGKDDPVPMIPLADWGYKHYGKELYTPTVEADSDFSDKAQKATETMNSLTGKNYRNNPELNIQLRTVLSYLCELMPTPTDYKNKLQSELVDFIGNTDPDFYAILTKIVESFKPANEEESDKLLQLYNYVQLLLNRYVLQGNTEQKNDGSWDGQDGIAANVFLEHNITDYISWMFSTDDPDELYGQNTEFSSVTLSGKNKIDVYDEYGLIVSVDQSGKVTEAERSEDAPNVDIEVINRDGNINITIPGDDFYLIDVESATEQDILTSVVDYSGDTIKGSVAIFQDEHYQKGDQFFLMVSEEEEWQMVAGDGETIEDVTTGLKDIFKEYSTSIIMNLQGLNSMNLTLGGLLKAALFTLAFFLLLLIVSLVLLIIRLVRKKKRRTIPTIIMHIIVVFALVSLEVMAWYFIPAFTIIRTILQILSYVVIIVLALRAFQIRRRKLDLFILLGMAVLMAAAAILEPHFVGKVNTLKFIIVYFADAVFVAASCFMWRKKKTVEIGTAVQPEDQNTDNKQLADEQTDNKQTEVQQLENKKSEDKQTDDNKK